ncbi:GTP cyclohydrolase I [Limimonas halophila]|uniref:GTP cyclohydrolase I n=1 Tax=Limimonas halophila TaxID=1082479 RepID=A0A1G7MG22_9PROT|nr:GTP cyclohydrolase I [Limimonas halophila]SDF60564.1 GTP cyclohydrolase I [Limimonas halophila]
MWYGARDETGMGAAMAPRDAGSANGGQPDEGEAEAAVHTLLSHLGGAPDARTAPRVLDAFRTLFGGYGEDPTAFLERTFAETDGYDEMIVLNGVTFVSHSADDMLPIVGTAHIGYIPQRRVVGVSKLARVVDILARRLQHQERLTVEIADTIQAVLQPHGVAVVLRARHHGTGVRPAAQDTSDVVTSRMLGSFRSDQATRRQFQAVTGLTGG